MADDIVTLKFPATTDRVRLARTLVATIADEAGFDYDEVEDLRIAVDELCFALLDATPGAAHIELCANHQPGSVEVEGRSTGSDRVDSSRELSELSRQILVTVVDEYELALDDEPPRFRFHKSKS